MRVKYTKYNGLRSQIHQHVLTQPDSACHCGLPNATGEGSEELEPKVTHFWGWREPEQPFPLKTLTMARRNHETQDYYNRNKRQINVNTQQSSFSSTFLEY